MSKSLLGRVVRLENGIRPESGSGVVFLRDGETEEEAARRLGIKLGDGPFIVVREIMVPDDWSRAARHQQERLTRGEM